MSMLRGLAVEDVGVSMGLRAGLHRCSPHRLCATEFRRDDSSVDKVGYIFFSFYAQVK